MILAISDNGRHDDEIAVEVVSITAGISPTTNAHKAPEIDIDINVVGEAEKEFVDNLRGTVLHFIKCCFLQWVQEAEKVRRTQLVNKVDGYLRLPGVQKIVLESATQLLMNPESLESRLSVFANDAWKVVEGHREVSKPGNTRMLAEGAA